MTTWIYGCSDDLIEICGDLDEEISHYCPDDSKPKYLAFSDGTVLSIIYSCGGIWRINRLKTGKAIYTKEEATDSENNYSDRVYLEGEYIQWVVAGDHFIKTFKEK